MIEKGKRMGMSIAASLNPCIQSRSPNFRPPLGFTSANLSNNHCLRFPKFRPQFAVTCSSSSHDLFSPTTVDLDRSLSVKKKAMDISSQLRGTSIFLVGMSNSLKTSLGKLLAEALRYYYFDSDSLVEEAAGGRSSVEALKASNEQGLRESETEVLKQLSSMGRLVVCAGNGAVRSSTNLALLRHGISVWIDVPVKMVSPDEEYEDIKEGYATADATISLLKVASNLGCDDPTHVTAEDMTLEVLKEIEKLARVKKMIEEAATPF